MQERKTFSSGIAEDAYGFAQKQVVCTLTRSFAGDYEVRELLIELLLLGWVLKVRLPRFALHSPGELPPGGL